MTDFDGFYLFRPEVKTGRYVLLDTTVLAEARCALLLEIAVPAPALTSQEDRTYFDVPKWFWMLLIALLIGSRAKKEGPPRCGTALLKRIRRIFSAKQRHMPGERGVIT